jgi:hypothetical protein
MSLDGGNPEILGHRQFGKEMSRRAFPAGLFEISFHPLSSC